MGYKLHHPACRLNTRCGLNNWQFGERRRARPLSIGAGQAPPGAIGPLQASALGGGAQHRLLRPCRACAWNHGFN